MADRKSQISNEKPPQKPQNKKRWLKQVAGIQIYNQSKGKIKSAKKQMQILKDEN